MVISDRPEQFAVTTSMLKKEGFNIAFENDLCRGIDLVNTSAPEVIISELAGPNLDGLELCSIIRRAGSPYGPQVVLVGDLSKRSSIVADGLDSGAIDYLQKPIDPIELYERCSGLLATDAPAALPMDEDENLFLSLIDNISEAVTIVGAEGSVLFESPSAARILGYATGALLGKQMAEFVHPADLSEFNEFINSGYWIGDSADSMEYRLRCDDGSWKLVESVVRSIHDPRFGSAVAVTSREKAYEQFALGGALENDVLRQALFDNAAIGMAVLSPSGHIIETNRALREMLDHRDDELQGMALSEIILPRDPEADRRALADVMSGRRADYRFRNGYYLPDGDSIWGELTLVAIPGPGDGDRCLMVIFEDPFAAGSEPLEVKPVVAPAAHAANVLDMTHWKINKGLITRN